MRIAVKPSGSSYLAVKGFDGQIIQRDIDFPGCDCVDSNDL